MRQVQKRETLTGAILVGGRARRLGGLNKGLLKLEGQSLLQRLLKLLRSRCDQLLLVGDPRGPYAQQGVPIYPDRIANLGAPGGLYTALHHAAPGWLLLLACDLPHLDEEILDRLLEARSDKEEVLLYEAGGRLQTLVGLWHRRSLPQVERMLEEEQGCSMRRLAEALELKRLQASPEPFFNLNTPTDLRRLGISTRGSERKRSERGSTQSSLPAHPTS